MDNSKVLFIDDDNKPHTELDYVLYYLRYNKFSRAHIKNIKDGKRKALGFIKHPIWLKGLDMVDIDYIGGVEL